MPVRNWKLVFAIIVMVSAACSSRAEEPAPCADVGCACEGDMCSPTDGGAQEADAGGTHDAETDADVAGERPPLVEPEYSDDPLQALCEKVVFLEVDCLEYHCNVASSDGLRDRFREEMLEGTSDTPPCRERAEADAEFRAWLEEMAAWSCNDEQWRAYQCGERPYFRACDCEAPSNLGASCSTKEDCDAGDLTPRCLPSTTGGRCYAEYCTIPESAELFDAAYDARCGPGDVCSVQPADWTDTNGNLYPESFEYDGLEGLCVAGCRSQSDCPPERACQPLHFVSTALRVEVIRRCSYQCSNDGECVAGYRCDDGVCQFPCTAPDGMSFSAFCNATGGACEDDPERGTDYCVWP